MQKLKNKCVYILGGLIAFLKEQSNVAAFNEGEAHILYGIEPMNFPEPLPEPTLYEKVVDFILSPISAIIIISLVMVIGCIFFVKKKLAKAKKTSKTSH